MVARCSCGLVWNISIYAEIPKEGYQCPICETKEKKAKRKALNSKKKYTRRVSNVLQRNKDKFSKN